MSSHAGSAQKRPGAKRAQERPVAKSSRASRTDRRQIARRLADIIRHGAQGVALAKRLAREGVRTRADLKKPAVLARLPREAQANVLYPPVRQIPLSVAEAVVAQLGRRLVIPVANCEVVPVGSVRRKAPRVKDLDVLIITPAGSEALVGRALSTIALRRAARPADSAEIVDTYISGKRRRSLVLRVREPGHRRARYYHVDLFASTQAERPFAMFHYTGSTAYNIRTRAFAKRKGWRLNQYGLFDVSTGRRVRGSSAIRTEKELARFLGVSYREPTDRLR
jgi:hypothetical protein